MSYWDCSKSGKIWVLSYIGLSILTVCISFGVLVGWVETNVELATAFAFLALAGVFAMFAGDVCECNVRKGD